MGEEDASKLLSDADAAYDARDLEGALKGYNDALAANLSEREKVDALFGLGRVQTDREDYGEAREAYGRAAEALSRAIAREKQRTSNDYELARLYNDIAVAKALSGELESSLEDFSEAIQWSHHYTQAWRSAGQVLMALHRYPEAREKYEAAIGQLPDDGRARYGLARALATEGDGRALIEVRKAIGLMRDAEGVEHRRSSAEPYLFLAWALRTWGGDGPERRSALEKAIRLCEDDIKDRRDPPRAKYLLAYCHLEQGDYAAAAADFDDAVKLLKGAGALQGTRADRDLLFQAYAGHGRALARGKQFEDARAAREQAVALAPPGASREYSLAELAYVLRRLGRVEEAADAVERAAESARDGGRLPRPGEKFRASGYRSWGILATETMIRIAVAEKYRDSSSWSDAVGTFEQAVRAAGGRVRAGQNITYDLMAPPPLLGGASDRVRRDEQIAYGILLTAGGYARWKLGDLQGAKADFSDAMAVLPPGSVDYFNAESALRRVRVAQSFRLPRRLPHWTTAAVFVLVGATTALEAVRRLSGTAWAVAVLGLSVLAVASWCLPVIRTLKIGGAEFTKEVGYREEAQVVRLSQAPLTPDLPPESPLRPTPRPPARSLEETMGQRATPVGPRMDAIPVPSPRTTAAEPAETIAPALREAVGRARAEDTANAATAIPHALRQTPVYALGKPAGTVKDGHGTESDLLHFTIDSETPGEEIVMLPVFTGTEPMRTALLRNPDWQTLSVLEINGAALADNIDSDVHIVIDPWTGGEWQI